MTKKFYQYEKVEVSPETFIKNCQDSIRYTYEEIEKEQKRHSKKMFQLTEKIKKRQAEIVEAQSIDMEAAKSRSSKSEKK